MWCANPFVYHFDCMLIFKLLKVLSVVAKGAVNDHLFIAFENSFEYHPNFFVILDCWRCVEKWATQTTLIFYVMQCQFTHYCVQKENLLLKYNMLLLLSAYWFYNINWLSKKLIYSHDLDLALIFWAVRYDIPNKILSFYLSLFVSLLLP